MLRWAPGWLRAAESPNPGHPARITDAPAPFAGPADSPVVRAVMEHRVHRRQVRPALRGTLRFSGSAVRAGLHAAGGLDQAQPGSLARRLAPGRPRRGGRHAGARGLSGRRVLGHRSWHQRRARGPDRRYPAVADRDPGRYHPGRDRLRPAVVGTAGRVRRRGAGGLRRNQFHRRPADRARARPSEAATPRPGSASPPCSESPSARCTRRSTAPPWICAPAP